MSILPPIEFLIQTARLLAQSLRIEYLEILLCVLLREHARDCSASDPGCGRGNDVIPNLKVFTLKKGTILNSKLGFASFCLFSLVFYETWDRSSCSDSRTMILRCAILVIHQCWCLQIGSGKAQN